MLPGVDIGASFVKAGLTWRVGGGIPYMMCYNNGFVALSAPVTAPPFVSLPGT